MKQKIVASSLTLTMIIMGILAIMSFSKISPREAGIEVYFGKVQPHVLHSGSHWLNPFSTVEKLDTSIQTLDLSSDDRQKDDKTPPVKVQIKNLTIAYVPVKVRWQIDARTDQELIDLYKSNKTSKGGVFENIKDNVVETAVQQAVQKVFASYDPLAHISDGADSNVTTDFDVYEQRIKEYLNIPGIKIVSVIVKIPALDEQTNKAINDYAKALAAYRVAVQQKLTNEALAAANAALAASAASSNPAVLYQNCLDMIKQLADRDKLKDLPASFTCDPARGSIIVNSK